MLIRQEFAIHDSPSEKAKFTEDNKAVRPLSWDEFRILQSTKNGKLKSNLCPRTEIHEIGVKVHKTQLVEMRGAEFNGDIMSYAIWLPNISSKDAGTIVETLKGYNPDCIGPDTTTNETGVLFQCRKECLRLVTIHEHLSRTWEWAREDGNEIFKSMRSDNLVKSKHEDFDSHIIQYLRDTKRFYPTGYNLSNKFHKSVRRLIW